MTETLSFTLPRSRERGRHMSRRTARLDGLLRLAGSTLVIEWSGAVEVAEVRGPEVETRVEAVPTTRREIPVERLSEVALRGWWRPCLEIRVTDLAALEGVPAAASGRLSLRIPRAERRAAQLFVVSLKDEMADAALRAVGGD